MLINIEGLDGSGKTTIIELLKKKVVALNLEKHFIFTREPGSFNSQTAEEIRKIILNPQLKIDNYTEALLFTASRNLHIKHLITPNYQTKIIITDRYYDSFYAYQGFGRQLGYQWVKTLTELILDEHYPHLSFYLDLPLNVAYQRRQIRSQTNPLDVLSYEFFQRVKEGYQKIINEHKNRYVIIDALAPAQTIANQIWEEIISKEDYRKIFKKDKDHKKPNE